MRIVHYLRQIRITQGGVVRAVMDFCVETAAAGHDVTLLTYDPHDVPRRWMDHSIPPAPPGAPGVPRCVAIPRPSLPGQLFSRAAREQIEPHVRTADVVHLHGVWTPSNSQVARLCDRHHKPYILTPHGMLDDWPMSQKWWKKAGYFYLVAQPFLERAAFVHCTARAELDQAAKWFPKGRGRVVHLPFDFSPYEDLRPRDLARERFGVLGNGKPSVLFLSRLHKKKGLDVLIRAAGLLRSRGVEFNLLISGPGSEAEIAAFKALAEQVGAGGCTHVLGFITPEEKFRLYRGVDLFCLPSHMENFGIVYFEALSSELPVLTTRVDTWPELEASGGARILDQTPEAFAGAIQALLGDPAQRARMGVAGRAWVRENLARTKVLGELATMYRDASAWAAARRPA